MKFLIDTTEDGGYGFTMVADDGQLLATGQGCSDKAALLARVAGIMHGAGAAAIEDRTEPGPVPESSVVPLSGEPDMARLGRSDLPPI
ncbi:YegP family protein [Micromonospora auratinigra]|uniref:Uncharacterized conserved protein YegP, UPF0339 family n=1 Tax=Micromonospora auratinigra TaxID=261654 RepID=A0A1A8Z7N7_9ACTN|nr:YegP family protein [Micromonospora auratinigra]SBT39880.1 Uncharacterized conserved protein YegP, UPF0339 family [Micromonospora auratinigra]